MKKILQQLFIYILPLIFFTACEKEKSYEAGTTAGTAVFSFGGGTGNCTGAVVSGSYIAGVAAGATNTVTLSANVATAGTYTISTSAVNGITFSGTGSFATTGVQSIVLLASGTPTTSGNFNFTPGTAGCTFSVTVTSGTGSSSGTAVFTYGGGTGDCTGAVLAGTYTAGTALTAANTVKLQVTVDTIGTYTISTAAVNGIAFSGSGTFTATGVQTITLTGTGTPVAAGNFNFKAGSSGCSFSVAVVNNSTASGSFYYDITVNGVQYKRVADSAGNYGFGVDELGDDSATIISSISYYGTPEPLGATAFTVSKGLLYNYQTATFTDFKNFLAPGSYGYAGLNSLRGITIEWKDANDKIWKSNIGMTIPSGSSFTIVSSEEFNFNGVQMVKVYAEFTCTLYDDAGNSILVTNGKYLSAFEKI